MFGQLLDPYVPRLPIPDERYWSALTYDEPGKGYPPPFHGPPTLNAVLVGTGSIGGSAVYAFRNTPGLTGTLSVVDPQHLEPRNVPKGILATADVADAGRGKAEVTVEALAHHPSLECCPFEGDVDGFHATMERKTLIPIVLAAVDTLETREAIQDSMPIRVINAACNADAFTLSGHITDNGPVFAASTCRT